nr:hypothetical protein [uncultured Cupriavidus sp.]
MVNCDISPFQYGFFALAVALIFLLNSEISFKWESKENTDPPRYIQHKIKIFPDIFVFLLTRFRRLLLLRASSVWVDKYCKDANLQLPRESARAQLAQNIQLNVFPAGHSFGKHVGILENILYVYASMAAIPGLFSAVLLFKAFFTWLQLKDEGQAGDAHVRPGQQMDELWASFKEHNYPVLLRFYDYAFGNLLSLAAALFIYQVVTVAVNQNPKAEWVKFLYVSPAVEECKKVYNVEIMPPGATGASSHTPAAPTPAPGSPSAPPAAQPASSPATHPGRPAKHHSK